MIPHDWQAVYNQLLITELSAPGLFLLQICRVIIAIWYVLLILYWAITRSKFDYGCLVFDTAMDTNLEQPDSLHPQIWIETVTQSFLHQPVSILYTEAPLWGRWLELRYYLKTRTCIGSPEHHALHEFERRPNCIVDMSKCLDSRHKISEYRETQGPHDGSLHQRLQNE